MQTKTCFHGLLSLRSYIILYCLLGSATAHSELGPPSLITNQAMLHNVPTRHSDVGSSSYARPFSQVCQVDNQE